MPTASNSTPTSSSAASVPLCLIEKMHSLPAAIWGQKTGLDRLRFDVVELAGLDEAKRWAQGHRPWLYQRTGCLRMAREVLHRPMRVRAVASAARGAAPSDRRIGDALRPQAACPRAYRAHGSAHRTPPSPEGPEEWLPALKPRGVRWDHA